MIITTFIGGPAHGVTLTFKRHPPFLRVVCDRAGKFDVLDQLADTPGADETIHAYILAEKPKAMGMIDSKDYSGPFGRASYRFIEEQPDDAAMRDTQRWRDWCRAEAGRVGG